MTSLNFRFDWDTLDESILAPELRTTWARLEVWVAGRCITFVEDLPSRSIRRSLSVPLYPIAEWIAFNWCLLRFNGRTRQDPGHLDRRNLRSAGDGITWPDIEIVPAGEMTSVQWRAGPTLDGDSIRYLSDGQAWVSTTELQGSLGDFVEAIVLRLQEFGISASPLQDEWSRLRALDREEAAFCEAAARLGFDPFSDGLDQADAIAQVFERLPPELHPDFFDAVNPAATNDALNWIDDALAGAAGLEALPGPRFGLELVSSTAQDYPPPADGTPPWVVGYEVARIVRQELGMSPIEPMPDDLPVRTQVRPSSTAGVTAVGTTLPRRTGPAWWSAPMRLKLDDSPPHGRCGTRHRVLPEARIC